MGTFVGDMMLRRKDLCALCENKGFCAAVVQGKVCRIDWYASFHRHAPYDSMVSFVPDRYEYPYGPDKPVAVIYPAPSRRSALDKDADEYRLFYYLRDRMEQARGRTETLQAVDEGQDCRVPARGQSVEDAGGVRSGPDGLAGDREYWTWSC